MAAQGSGSLRARVRAELIDEIKATARRHLAVEGADLSLRAVARDLGLVSSAIYRYFPSRDELLTALIVDAYNALGEAAERAEAAVPRRDLAGRFLATCHAVRRWALANPHEYTLIYGSPVPGYAAPADTVDPAARPSVLLTAVLRDGVESGVLAVRPGERLPRELRADLRRLLADPRYAGVPEAVLARGLTVWVQLFGLIGFEVFGRLDQVVEHTAVFFEHQARVMLAQVGLPAPTRRTAAER